MSEKITGLFICMPALGRTVQAETTESLFCLAQVLTANKIPCQYSWFAAADPEESRNLFLSIWYDGMPTCSHILFVDADMAFTPLLIRDMLAFDKPVVGCYYARRQFPAVAVGKSLTSDDKLEEVENGFLKVAGVGGGVLMIRRDAITTMLEKLPDIIDDNPKSIALHPGIASLEANKVSRLIRAFDKLKTDDGIRLSEDFSFCERWRKSGGDVWANVDHLIGHVGPFNYAIRYMDFLEQQDRDKKEAA